LELYGDLAAIARRPTFFLTVQHSGEAGEADPEAKPALLEKLPPSTTAFGLRSPVGVFRSHPLRVPTTPKR
jgi:hypothetical protein